MEVSIQAGDIVGRLYDVFLQQYQGETTQTDLHALNVLCVRLVFCLYAEDAGVFAKDQFVEYLQSFRPENMRMALIDLFRVLDTPQEARSRMAKRGEGPDRLESAGNAFHDRVYEGYLAILRAEEEQGRSRIVRLDATRDAETVKQDLFAVLDRRFASWA